MDDLISRQAAIDALGEKPLAWEQGEYEEGLQTQWESDVEAIKALPSVEPHWILVTERLPEKDGEYLTTWIDAQKKLCVNVFLVENGVWYWNQKYIFPNWRIIAWMPLPEPFNEVTE